jgi:hypothetical protein
MCLLWQAVNGRDVESAGSQLVCSEGMRLALACQICHEGRPAVQQGGSRAWW